MFKFEKLLASPTLMVAVLASASFASAAQAAPDTVQVEPSVQNESQVIRQMGQDPLRARNGSSVAQVTSVSQLSDVKTTDWAFTALQSLVERYGCIAGYPDKTYRGQRAMTRYEFAAGLNACLDKINELITAGLADKVSKEDLAALQRLQEEFAAELAALKGRVDKLEAQVTTLEAQQFSTTTKLNAIGIFALSGTANDQAGIKTNTTFSGRIRLNFDTSFTGKDRLRVRLQAGNITRFDSAIAAGLGGRMTRLAFDGSSPVPAGGTAGDNSFILDDFYYNFPVGSTITGFVGVSALDLNNVFNTFNPLLESADTGSLSRFGRYNPLLFRATGQGAGAAIVFRPSPQFAIRAAYLANGATAGNAVGQGGVSGGAYVTGAQLEFSPTRDIALGLQYLKSFEPATALSFDQTTGSTRSQLPVGRADTSSDRYGFLANWRIAKQFNIGGSVGFANARAESGPNRGATADVLTWDVKLAFPDLFADGNLAAIIFGQQPRVTGTSGLPLAISGSERSTSYHLEALYRFRVTKNISITPGLFVVFNPNNDDRNNTIVVGTIRTTFSF
jgi:Carbohydrate-selective porin, OprB family/S-layer homology domain